MLDILFKMNYIKWKFYWKIANKVFDCIGIFYGHLM